MVTLRGEVVGVQTEKHGKARVQVRLDGSKMITIYTRPDRVDKVKKGEIFTLALDLSTLQVLLDVGTFII